MKLAKIATKDGQAKIHMVDVPEPQVLHGDDVKIKIHYVTICAEDMNEFIYGATEYFYDRGTCHEYSGEIVDLGEDAKWMGFSVGDRVSGYSWCFCGMCPYCRRGLENLCLNIVKYQGALAEYVVVKDRQIYILPREVSMLEGCMTELVSSCIHATELAGMAMGKTCLILGGGGAGQTFVRLAKLQGASRITLSEPLGSKRLLAKKRGVDYVVDPTKESLLERCMDITDSLCFDIIIDATGNAESLDGITGLLGRGGVLMLTSMPRLKAKFVMGLFEAYNKEYAVRTSFMAPHLLPRTMEILSEMHMQELVGRIFQMHQAQQAFEAARTKKYPRVAIDVLGQGGAQTV